MPYIETSPFDPDARPYQRRVFFYCKCGNYWDSLELGSYDEEPQVTRSCPLCGAPVDSELLPPQLRTFPKRPPHVG